MFYDVIVIGAGLAGLMAAEVAQRRGARVLVLARGMGSLPLTTACLDALGYFPPTSGEIVKSPLATLPQLIAEYPHHPYALVGLSKVEEAFSYFQKLTQKIGLPYCGSLNSNFLLPTPLGTFRPTCLVPETMSAGDLTLPGPVLLLGFSGLKDFSPYLAAATLNQLKEQQKIAAQFRVEIIEKINGGGSSLHIAAAFDQESFRKDLIKSIKMRLKPAERLGLPAVMGLHSSSEALADLQDQLQTKVFEIPLPPPSVPGLRLQSKLRNHLQSSGGRLLIGLAALLPQKEGEYLSGFALGSSKYSPSYTAASFVLATGKFVGGGLEATAEKIEETLLHLPLSYPEQRREWFNRKLLGLTGQPFNSIGIAVNENLQPVNAGGKVIYKNLFAAGGIIGHSDSMTEKSGGGIALATGYLAGELAAKYAGF
ncbi:MAG: anaerobic glycerol-3-phosphate dehydrogenase subunit GlpB [Thermodesulfobacteriota bacterium]